MGYVALAPDLFWRQEPGIQLTDQSKEEWDQALALLKGFDVDKGVQDLQAAMNYLRAQPYCTGQVGAVGYCLGGKLAYLMSTRTDINLAVSYYGVGLGALMPEAVRIQSPLLMHIAEQDKFVSPDEQHLIKTSLQGHPHAQIYSYLGVDHAFTRLNGEHYDAAAAQQANDRTTAFITKYLPLV
jgi:carboxymethylenebutenolidase